MDQPVNKAVTDKDEVFPDQQCRLLLIGKTGNGKSSTGNTILGREVFKAQSGINSKTKECGYDETKIDDLRVLVMDTPGLSDTEGEDEILKERIARSLYSMAPGPHAVLMVLRCDLRFTLEEYQVTRVLKEAFGEKLTEYLIVIFAGKDRLGENGENLFEEEVRKATKLNDLLDESHRRYVLFDNSTTVSPATKKEQVAKLISNVRDVVKHNKGSYFLHKEARAINMSMVKMLKDEIRVKTDRLNTASGVEAKPQGKSKVKGEDNTYSGNDDEDATPVMREMQAMIQKGTVKMQMERLFKAETFSKPLTKSEERLAFCRNEHQCENIPAPPPQEQVRLLSDTEGPSYETKSTEEMLLAASTNAVSKRELPLNSDADTDSASTPTDEHDKDSDVDEHDVSTEESIEDNYLAPDAGQWLEDDPKLGSLLAQSVNASHLTVEQEEQTIEDDLRRKLAIAPVQELSPVQRECLDKTAKSADIRLHKGMKKFAVSSIDKCRLM